MVFKSAVTFFVVTLSLVNASIWRIGLELDGMDVYEFGRHMFKRGEPFGMSGDAYMKADFTATGTLEANPHNPRIVTMFYHMSADEPDPDLLYLMCDAGTPDDGKHYEHFTVPIDESTGVAVMAARANIVESGLNYVAIAGCGVEEMVIEGELTFHNPYGYLEAVLYGLLPYTLVEVFVLFVFVAAFGYLAFQHREDTLPIHHAILLLGGWNTWESLFWFISYWRLNSTGAPICCPLPGVVIAAFVFEVVRKAGVRLLMLLVCLGYGVARAELSRSEMSGIISLSGLYLVTSMAARMQEIVESNDMSSTSVAKAQDEPPVFWSLVSSLASGALLMWTCLALLGTQKELQESGQRFKLEMYRTLGRAVVFFLLVLMVLGVVTTAEQTGHYAWSWEWLWVPIAVWRAFELCVLVTVAVIWRPTATSSMYAYAFQLPSSDEEALEVEMAEANDDWDNENGGGGGGLEEFGLQDD